MDVAERARRKGGDAYGRLQDHAHLRGAAESQLEATNRMMEALMLHVERDFHVIDYVKTPEDADGKGHKIDLNPPKGWLSLLLQELAAQLTGRPVKDDRPWTKPKVYKGKSMHEQELGKR